MRTLKKHSLETRNLVEVGAAHRRSARISQHIAELHDSLISRRQCKIADTRSMRMARVVAEHPFQFARTAVVERDMVTKLCRVAFDSRWQNRKRARLVIRLLALSSLIRILIEVSALNQLLQYSCVYGWSLPILVRSSAVFQRRFYILATRG